MTPSIQELDDDTGSKPMNETLSDLSFNEIDQNDQDKVESKASDQGFINNYSRVNYLVSSFFINFYKHLTEKIFSNNYFIN